MTEARAGVTREVREFKPQDLEHRSFTLCIVETQKQFYSSHSCSLYIIELPLS